MSLWTAHHFAAPIFGTLCFLVGAAVVFVATLGRWRVRRWPTFRDRKQARLEPDRERVGRYTYISPDLALFVGIGCLAAALFLAGLYSLISRGSPVH